MTRAQPTQNLVSVIIPCYNAEHFIKETVQSVLNQTYNSQLIEIIIVNDGSKDNSEKVIQELVNETSIRLINKPNSGVSDSRNKGLDYANGEFILYLDADDLLAPDFLEKRIQILNDNKNIGYCTSQVVKIDGKSTITQKGYRGPFGNKEKILSEVLLYQADILNCPSSFLIRHQVIYQHHLVYNTQLSSSADRFYLIELANVTSGAIVETGAEMLYRIHPLSMSQVISPSLINDNQKYLLEIVERNYIPQALKIEVLSKLYYILAGGYWHVGNWKNFIKYASLTLYYNPLRIFQKIMQPFSNK